jgi:hypothetical protein
MAMIVYLTITEGRETPVNAKYGYIGPAADYDAAAEICFRERPWIFNMRQSRELLAQRSCPAFGAVPDKPSVSVPGSRSPRNFFGSLRLKLLFGSSPSLETPRDESSKRQM